MFAYFTFVYMLNHIRKFEIRAFRSRIHLHIFGKRLNICTFSKIRIVGRGHLWVGWHLWVQYWTQVSPCHSVYKVGAGSFRRPFSAALCSAEIRIRLGAVRMHTTDPPSRTNSRNQHGQFLALARQRGGLLAAREPPDATEGREHVRASDRDAGS